MAAFVQDVSGAQRKSAPHSCYLRDSDQRRACVSRRARQRTRCNFSAAVAARPTNSRPSTAPPSKANGALTGTRCHLIIAGRGRSRDAQVVESHVGVAAGDSHHADLVAGGQVDSGTVTRCVC